MEKHLEIIDAAIRLFSEKGIASTTVDEISREAGVAKGSFYKMFGSKDELLFRIMCQFLDSVQELTAYVLQLEHLTPIEKCEKFCSLALEHVYEQKHFFLSVFSTSETDFNCLVKSNPSTAEFDKKVMSMMKEIMINTHGKEIDPFVWDVVIIFNSMMREYAGMIVKVQPSFIPKVARLIARLLDSVVIQFREGYVEPVITAELREQFEQIRMDPADKGNLINDLFHMLDRKIQALEPGHPLKAELTKTLKCLKEESGQSKPRSFMVKSLLGYLHQQNELSELCERLERLLLSS